MVPVGAVRGLALLEALIGAMYPPIIIREIADATAGKQAGVTGARPLAPFDR